jgi:hypothetical protein
MLICAPSFHFSREVEATADLSAVSVLRPRSRASLDRARFLDSADLRVLIQLNHYKSSWRKIQDAYLVLVREMSLRLLDDDDVAV